MPADPFPRLLRLVLSTSFVWFAGEAPLAAHSVGEGNGHAHIDEAEIWLVHEGSAPTYESVTTGGKNIWPMWGAAGTTVSPSR